MFYSLLVDAHTETKNLDIGTCIGIFIKGTRHEKNNNVDWFPNRYDTKKAVQAQKMARDWKYLDLESQGIILSV